MFSLFFFPFFYRLSLVFNLLLELFLISIFLTMVALWVNYLPLKKTSSLNSLIRFSPLYCFLCSFDQKFCMLAFPL